MKASLLLFLFFSFFLCCPILTAKSESDLNKIEICLDKYDGVESVADITFSVYKIGSVKNGEPSIAKQYGITDYPQTGQMLDRAAKKIAEETGLSPILVSKTDERGILLFENLPDGVYLIKEAENSTYGEIAPFIIHLPYYKEEKGVMIGPVYTVSVTPKYSPYETDIETETKTSETEQETGKAMSNEKNTQYKSHSKTPVKTGDSNNFSLYFFLFCSSLAIILLLLYKKYFKSDKKRGM